MRATYKKTYTHGDCADAHRSPTSVHGMNKDSRQPYERSYPHLRILCGSFGVDNFGAIKNRLLSPHQR